MPRRYEQKRRRKSGIQLVDVPSWAVSGHHDGPGLASALALADLEGKWIRLDAPTQRKLLGFPIFGKRAIRAESDGVRVGFSAAFGTDFSVEIYPWEMVTHAARRKTRIWDHRR